MIQQLQQPKPRQSEARRITPLRKGLYVRLVFFLLFLLIAALLALPALLLGLVLWLAATHAADRREFWRGLWAIALFCVLIYAVWIGLSNPLADIWRTLSLNLSRHALGAAEQAGLRLWIWNLWLAPLCAPLLAFLFPRSLFCLLQQTPKERPVQDEQEQTIHTARLLARLRQVVIAQQEPPFPAAVTPFVSRTPDRIYALGQFLHGELVEYVQREFFCLPPAFFDSHGVLVGEPGAGKSTTLIRLAAIARAYGRRIIYLDLKASRKTAALFFAAMVSLGVRRFRVFPTEAYDGWRGDGQALYNRLMQQIDPSSHPFYRSGVGSTILSLACKAPGGPPRSSTDLLHRLDSDWLQAAYANDSQALREIENIAPYIAGAALVFSGFFRGVNGGLDGKWAFEDCDACYLGIDGIAHREEAAALGRYLLDDAAHFASVRKAPAEQALLLIDEFGVLESVNTTRLYEGVREAGLCVYAAGQSYQSLGRERDNLLGASQVKILHRCGSPEHIIKYAGKREAYKFSLSLGEAGDLAHPYANTPENVERGILHPQDEYAVSIEDVQQLAVGEIVVLCAGRPAAVRVKALSFSPQLVRAAGEALSRPPDPPVPESGEAESTGKVFQRKNTPEKESPEPRQLGGPKRQRDQRPQLAPPARGRSSREQRTLPEFEKGKDDRLDFFR